MRPGVREHSTPPNDFGLEQASGWEGLLNKKIECESVINRQNNNKQKERSLMTIAVSFD